jgi:hypothetical protein
LRRTDGLATRIDWQPTPIHRHFLKVLRAHARRLTAGISSLGHRRSPSPSSQRRMDKVSIEA